MMVDTLSMQRHRGHAKMRACQRVPRSKPRATRQGRHMILDPRTDQGRTNRPSGLGSGITHSSLWLAAMGYKPLAATGARWAAGAGIRPTRVHSW